MADRIYSMGVVTSNPHSSETPPSIARVNQVIDSGALWATLGLLVAVPVEDLVKFGPLSLSRVAAAVAVLIVIAKVITIRQLIVDRPLLMVIVSFMLWLTASYFWSYSPSSTMLYASTMLQLGMLVLIVWQTCVSSHRWRLALGALSVGGLAGSVVSLLDTVSAQNGIPRYAVGDPNDFGITLSITVVTTTYLALSNPRLRMKIIWSIVAALEVLAIARTASRAAAIAVVIGLLIMLVQRSAFRVRPLLSLGGMSVIIYFGLSRVASGAALSRLGSTLPSLAEGDLNNRTTVWGLAIQYWTSAPVVGVGGGAFRTKSLIDGSDKVAHSVPLGLLAELGAVGLILFMLILVLSWRNLVHAQDAAGRRVIFAAWACWLCGALTLTMEIRKVTWLLIALSACRGFAWSTGEATSDTVVAARTRRPTGAL